MNQCDNIAMNLFDGLERRDGQPFTCEDEDALLEFGGIYHVVNMILSVVRPPGGSEQLESHIAPDNSKLDQQSLQTHRYPGEAETQNLALWDDDDDDVDEFSGLRMFFKFLMKVIEVNQTESIGLFPPADNTMSQVGEAWGYNLGLSRKLERIDGQPMTEEDDDALMQYGAWVWMGTTLIGIYRMTFGYSLRSCTSSKVGIQRSPSGAELSAALGRTIQNSLGLDDPKRKVHARGIL